eukprot:CAMPEP_0184858382 /NCGR_PEP_ID=MMETSP0580-20130426/3493_1 /TAXON_ID=1118495 /ORGANISM="Dactyliosolen fragilissimus" /LENGTH=669 /DNA_ID=CAMNT_0027354501 /DNA_START=117 /DNA_END=2126 /DNA_ORIENTATION=-
MTLQSKIDEKKEKRRRLISAILDGNYTDEEDEDCIWNDENDGNNHNQPSSMSEKRKESCSNNRTGTIPHSNHNDEMKRERQDRKNINYTVAAAKPAPQTHIPPSTYLYNFIQRPVTIPASKVASLAGFNRYASLPTILMELVYQGYQGQKQLQKDSKLLGVTLTSAQQELEKLATKAGGAQTRKALKEATSTVGKDVTDAQRKKQNVLERAKSSGALNKNEMKRLTEGLKYAVNTNFGTKHEENALDIYSQQCGWEVRERNAQIKRWDFIRSEDRLHNMTSTSQGPTGTGDMPSLGYQNNMPSVIPLSDPFPLYQKSYATENRNMQNSKPQVETKRKQPKIESKALNSLPKEEVIVIDYGENDSNIDNMKKAHETGNEKQNISGHSKCSPMNHNIITIPDSPSPHKKVSSDNRDFKKKSLVAQKPFFSILGAIDGMRDELYHRPNTNTMNNDCEFSEEEWGLRPVVVECKHRMGGRAFIPPPMYDQIQAILYCLMYKTTEADIVQVVRKKRLDEENLDIKCQESSKDSKGELCAQSQIDCSKAKSDQSKDIKVDKQHEKGHDITIKQQTLKQEIITEITNTRISLEDDTNGHRTSWHNIILPRLRSFIGMVYTIRADDDKRYKMLMNMAMSSSGTHDEEKYEHDLWNSIFHECPWLKDCDNVYQGEGTG